jgi:hypothetical protein
MLLNNDVLRAAYVPLNYDCGFPMQDDGRPFWERFLQFEPLDAFVAFQAYLQQGTNGRRQMFLMADDQTTQQQIARARVLINRTAARNTRLSLVEHLPPAPKADDRGASHGHSHSADDGRRIAGSSAASYGDELAPPLYEERPSQVSKAKADGESRFGPLQGSGFLPNAISDTLDAAEEALSVGPGTSVAPQLHGVSSSRLAEWFYLYSWGPRAEAHDMFYTDSVNHAREMMTLQLENQHYLAGSQIFKEVMGFITDKDKDGESAFWAQMTPKTAVDLLKASVEMQRLALGNSPNAPSKLAILGQSPTAVRGKATGFAAGGSGSQPAIRQLAAPNTPTSGEQQQVGGPTSGSGGIPGRQAGALLEAEDRARRVATLLDRARARKAGGD